MRLERIQKLWFYNGREKKQRRRCFLWLYFILTGNSKQDKQTRGNLNDLQSNINQQKQQKQQCMLELHNAIF